MARANRFAPAGTAYHVVNRGNDRRAIFLQPSDYQVFMRLMRAGTRKFDVDIHAYCAMPNHFHLVVEPNEDDALSAYMQWVTGCYSCHLRNRTRTVGYGHVFQRRFWSAPVTDDLHFWMLVRYVEANPPRAKLIDRAEKWPWSSLVQRLNGQMITERCGQIPADWCELVNLIQRPEVLDRLRKEIARRRGRPPRR